MENNIFEEYKELKIIEFNAWKKAQVMRLKYQDENKLSYEQFCKEAEKYFNGDRS